MYLETSDDFSYGVNLFVETEYPIDERLAASIESVLDEPECENFKYWFALSITKDNYIRPDESIVWKYLEKDTALTEERLNDELKSHVPDPDEYLWDGNDCDLLDHRNLSTLLLNQSYCFQEEFKQVQKRTENEIYPLKIEVKKWENIMNAEERRVMGLRDKYKHNFDEVCANWTKLNNNINIHGTGSEAFLCKQQTETYSQLNRLFEVHWTSVERLFYLMGQSKNLLEPSLTPASTLNSINNKTLVPSTILNYLNGHLQRAAFDLQEAEKKYVILFSEIAGISAAMEYFNDFYQKISEIDVQQSFDYLSVTVQYCKEPKMRSEAELQIKCQNYIECIIIQKGNEAKSKKTEWKKNKLMYFTELETILKKRELLNSLFWRFRRREAKIFETAEILLSTYKEIVTKDQHQKLKETLYSCHNVQMNPVVKNIGLMLSGISDLKDYNSYEDIITQIKLIEGQNENTLEQIINNLTKQTETVKSSFHLMKRFEQYLFVGPTHTLTILDDKFVGIVKHLQSQQDIMENKILLLRKKFSRHKELQQDPYRHIVQNMWIDLLKQPDKLMSDVHKIQMEANSLHEEVMM